MTRSSLPPGFRFHPTDVELVLYYLKRKIKGKKLHVEAIAEVNIYKFAPWDLPDKSCIKSRDLEWFFFCPREMKYLTGARVKRATENGYWKTTGKDRPILYKNGTVGTVKTLVFHQGHAPNGERTDWVIHEYKIIDAELAASGLQDTYVLCKVFKKNGPGPKTGAQYGAPFNEADWASDDDADAQNNTTSDGPPPTEVMLPGNHSHSAIASLFDPGSTYALSLTEGGPSVSAGPSVPAGPSAANEAPVDESDTEIVRLLACFTDDASLLSGENGNHHASDMTDDNGKGKDKVMPQSNGYCVYQTDDNGKANDKAIPQSDGYDIYNNLGDLNNWNQMNNGNLDFSGTWSDGYPLNSLLPLDNSAFIELDDLQAPLNSSGLVNGTHQPSLDAIHGSYSQPLSSGGCFPIVDQHASFANQPDPFPQGFNFEESSLDMFQMVNNPFYLGFNDAAFHLDFSQGQQHNGGDFTQDMERGRHNDN